MSTPISRPFLCRAISRYKYVEHHIRASRLLCTCSRRISNSRIADIPSWSHVYVSRNVDILFRHAFKKFGHVPFQNGLSGAFSGPFSGPFQKEPKKAPEKAPEYAPENGPEKIKCYWIATQGLGVPELQELLDLERLEKKQAEEKLAANCNNCNKKWNKICHTITTSFPSVTFQSAYISSWTLIWCKLVMFM